MFAQSINNYERNNQIFTNHDTYNYSIINTSLLCRKLNVTNSGRVTVIQLQ